MTKKEIRISLKDAIRDGWIEFEDETDKEYFLKRLNDTNDDLEEILTDMMDSKPKKEISVEIINNMYDELSCL